MATPQEKAQCTSWFIETKSDTQTQRKFKIKYGRHPPSRVTIRAWHQKFMETGEVSDKHRAGRPRISEENVLRVKNAFQRSSTKSIRTAARELQLPRSTVHKVLHKRLGFHAYKMQLLHALEPNDKPRRKAFANLMLKEISSDETFLNRICFSDEATFHVSGKLNTHNSRIWGSENPHVTIELHRNSPKVNVWCGIMCNRIIGPYFFKENSITSNSYLALLVDYVAPQLGVLQPSIIFQQDGAPPHWGLRVREFLNRTFPDRWIGRDGPIPWPPRSPDITPLDFFLWGYVKDIVYRSKIRNITNLIKRITDAIDTIDESMLQRTWQEIIHRLHSLRSSDGDHIEIY